MAEPKRRYLVPGYSMLNWLGCRNVISTHLRNAYKYHVATAQLKDVGLLVNVGISIIATTFHNFLNYFALFNKT